MIKSKKVIESCEVPSNYIGTEEELQSKVISFLRFPLIVAVICIHSQPHEVNIGGFVLVDSNSLHAYTYINFLISNVIARIAVPLFFFISGFLFFKGSFNVESYKRKLERRCTSLLIPYLFWNLVVVTLFFLLQTFMPGLISGENKLVIDYTLADWIKIFWDGNSGKPICYQFWFIRDLMVVMVFSPLIYLGIKNWKGVLVILFSILYFFNIWFNFTGVNIAAFFFFTSGAYFNIMKQSFLLKMNPYMSYTLILYPILCFFCLVLKDSILLNYFLKLSIIVGIISAITLTGYYINIGKWHVNSFLSESSFFIYAYHATVLALIVKIGVKFLSHASSGGLLIIYVLSVFLTIIIGVTIYYCIKRFWPNFTNFITGKR